MVEIFFWCFVGDARYGMHLNLSINYVTQDYFVFAKHENSKLPQTLFNLCGRCLR